MDTSSFPASLSVPLDRDSFLRDLIRDLTEVLEQVIGIDEAAGFISLVGQQIGRRLDALYRQHLNVPRLNREQVAWTLVDLKKRIKGNFSILSQDNERIILVNTTCPFADQVLERPSMCMITSNVFGVITADNLGYARVTLEQTIASGDTGCRVVIHLRPPSDDDNMDGLEYFGMA